MWQILNISEEPLEILPVQELPEPPSDVKLGYGLDIILANMKYFIVGSVGLIIIGMKLNSREKKKKRKTKTAKVNKQAILLSNERTSKMIRLKIGGTCKKGKKVPITVFIRNPSPSPYMDVKVRGIFPKQIRINTPTLNFGKVNPGEVAKRMWVMLPTQSGTFQIKDLTLSFEYKGRRYIGVVGSLKVKVI